jgi:ribose transport system permease protein
MSASTNPASDFGLIDERLSFGQRLRKSQTAQIMIVLMVLTALFSALAPDAFFTLFNLRNIFINVAVFAILGVGMTFVIITAGIDLSIGSILVFSTVIACKVIIGMGGQGWGATFGGFIACLVVATIWGAVNGWLVAIAKVPAFIVTLGTLSTVLGLAQIITGGIDLSDATDVMVDKIGFGNVIGEIPVLGVIALIFAIFGGVLLHKSKFGLTTYAIGSNIEGCRRVGINVNRHLIYVYALMGFCAGLAGFLSLSLYQQTTIAGQSNTALTVIAGVVIGGTSLFGGYGSIFGTMIGLLIPIVLQTGFIIIGIVPFWQNVVVGVFLVAAVYVDTARRAAAEGGGRSLKKRSLNESDSNAKGKK